MTKDEVKAMNNVPDVLMRYGIQVKRGRCRSICHEGKHYTAKVSDELYHCFKCGKSMDVFDIVMYMDNCDFKTAFELLGGADKPSFRIVRRAKSARKARQTRIDKQREFDRELRRIHMYIDAYRSIISEEKPFSDLWCYCQNNLQLELYHLEHVMDLKAETR